MVESRQSKPIKRFIAGAVCPRCGEMDKLVMWQLETAHKRECVACGFNDTTATEAGVEELPTRVTQATPKPETASQPIKFYPRPSKG